VTVTLLQAPATATARIGSRGKRAGMARHRSPSAALRQSTANLAAS
jgi:hypothetical protein